MHTEKEINNKEDIVALVISWRESEKPIDELVRNLSVREERILGDQKKEIQEKIFKAVEKLVASIGMTRGFEFARRFIEIEIEKN